MLKKEVYKLLRRLIVCLAVTVALICGADIIRDASQPDISSVPVTQDEHVIAALHTSAPPLISKYRINHALPPGTLVEVWVESYINGERLDDIASCQLVLGGRTKNLPIIFFRSGNEIAIAIGSSEQARGSFPTVESEYKNAGVGSQSPERRLRGPTTLASYFQGSSVAGGSGPGALQQDSDEFIRGTAAVQLLKVDIRRPGN